MGAVSLTAWSYVVTTGLLLTISAGTSGQEVGSAAVARRYLDNRTDETIIVDPVWKLGVGGLLTKFEAYVVETNNCIRLQIWRPLYEPSPRPTATESYRVTRSATRVSSNVYWVLVQQSQCVKVEGPNKVAQYIFPLSERIRFEGNDVVGFSYEDKNPIPYDVLNGTCNAQRKSQSPIRKISPGTFTVGNTYGFRSLNECRVYSLKVTFNYEACSYLQPSMSFNNITQVTRYDTTSLCWILQTPNYLTQNGSPQVMYLKFIQLTGLGGCEDRYVEIREGMTSTSRLIRRYCGMPEPDDVEVPPIFTGVAYIRFVRKRNLGDRHYFTLQYSTRKMTTECRDIPVTQNPVYIDSPNHPKHYPPNADICWRLTVADPVDRRVRVEVPSGIDLQPAVGCRRTETFNTCQDRHCKDFLEVRDGSNRSATLLTKWCDHTGDNLIETSSGKSMLVYFISDDSIQGTGFKIKAYAVHPDTAQCSHYVALFTDNTLQSPYYPYSYPPDRDDCWSVRANDDNLRILVTVHDSSLEADPICAKDRVEIRDGTGSSAPLLRRWCARTIPSQMMTSGPYLFVRFMTNGMGNFPGFSLSYKQVSSDECTTYYAYSHREYLAPDRDQDDKGLAIRCWLLRADTGKLRIQWDSSTPTSRVTMCGNTYIELRDGDSRDSDLIGKYCGSKPIPTTGVESTGNAIYVQWVSDVNGRPANFRLIYMSLSSGHCPLVTTGQHSVYLSNPLPGRTTTRYPVYYRTTAKPSTEMRPQPLEPCKTCKYGPNQQSCWTVEAERPDGVLDVKVRFVELQEKDERGQCTYDFLELRDGKSADAGLLAMLCGRQTPLNYTTSGRWLFIRFNSDSQVELRGFRLEVSSSYQDECQHINARNYGLFLKSPNYPEHFPPNTRRCWVIRSPSNQQPVRVEARHIALDADDTIEFYDGESGMDSLLRRFDISTKAGARVTSSDSAITIIAMTGKQDTSRGIFELQYSWVFEGRCEYVSVADATKSITTKDYGDSDYSMNDYSCWVITALYPQDTIEIQSDVFQLENSPGCASDYLEIYDGPKKSDEKLLHRLCGSRDGEVLARSSGRTLFVVFSTDGRNQAAGFTLLVLSKTPDQQASRASITRDFSDTTLLIIIIPIVCLVIILVIVIAVVCIKSRRSVAAAAASSTAPVVVYTHQPPAYTTGPRSGGATAANGHLEETKEPLPPDAESVDHPPPTPTTPTTTSDNKTLL